MSEEQTRLSVQLPSSMKKRIEALARERHCSTSVMARQALDRGLALIELHADSGGLTHDQRGSSGGG